MLKWMASSLKLLVKPLRWSLPWLLLPRPLLTLLKLLKIHRGWPLSKMLMLFFKKEVAPFGENFLISLSSQKNMVWTSLPKLKKRLDILVQGNHLFASVTMK